MKKILLASGILIAAAVVFIVSGSAFAAHPLITDDTGTQGKGKFQLEVNAEYAHDSNDGVTTEETTPAAAISYGITDTMDIVLGMPYLSWSVKDTSGKTSENGVSDASVDLKWRFYEHEGLSFALKPGATLPTGDDKKGLGNGKATYHMFFITTKELKPWAFHMNLGYIRNENKGDDRKDLWHVSAATEVELVKDLKFVADIGMERTPDKTSSIDPAYILGGLVYSLTEHFDIDFGIKGGLNKAEPDYALLAGITLRF
jgi:hypothetical protein